MTTKIVTFEGKQYEVPEWVNWVARDGNGDGYGYEEKPFLGCDQFDNEYGRIFTLFANNWRDSLTKV